MGVRELTLCCCACSVRISRFADMGCWSSSRFQISDSQSSMSWQLAVSFWPSELALITTDLFPPVIHEQNVSHIYILHIYVKIVHAQWFHGRTQPTYLLFCITKPFFQIGYFLFQFCLCARGLLLHHTISCEDLRFSVLNLSGNSSLTPMPAIKMNFLKSL
jgi:hypothetical protein